MKVVRLLHSGQQRRKIGLKGASLVTPGAQHSCWKFLVGAREAGPQPLPPASGFGALVEQLPGERKKCTVYTSGGSKKGWLKLTRAWDFPVFTRKVAQLGTPDVVTPAWN